MKILILINLFSFLLNQEPHSFISLESKKNESFFKLNQNKINKSNFELSKISPSVIETNNLRMIRGLESLIIPGLGQYNLDKKKKALLFASFELILIGASLHYRKKANALQKTNQAYGLKHWNFFTWISDYNKWDDGSSEYRLAFTDEDGVYPEIYVPGHGLEYNIDSYPGRISTSEDYFEDTEYPNLIQECNQLNYDCIENYFMSKGFELYTDHHFFENIAKYDNFFSGWDDNDEIYVYEKSSGEFLARSPNKDYYRDVYDDVNFKYEQSRDILILIGINHLLSALDAFFSNNDYFNKNKNLNFNHKFKYDLTNLNPSYFLNIQYKW